eukprot:GILK01006800.1.p1 GENE.GILK01006800.1~~GILK01006800.1.p1  ORF type:complete len:139 (-),score=6.21 GILK01006800.1:214-630(-)
MLFNLYIFNRQGQCLYYEEWNRKKAVKNVIEDQKLVFGLLWSLKSFTQKIAPRPVNTFNSFTTPTYKMHCFETGSGLKFILNTDPSVGDLKEDLRHLYSNVYVEYVSKNPLYSPNEPITCPAFSTNLRNYLMGLPCYK